MKTWDTWFMRKLLTRSALGIDVGNSHIKIVEVAGGEMPALLNYCVIPTPHGAIENSMVLKPEELVHCLRGALGQGRYSLHRSATVLTGQNLLVRHIELPALPRKDIARAIGWQLNQYFSLRAEDTLTDYHIISESRGEPLSIVVVAMNKLPVMKLVQVLSEAGVITRTVDIGPLAALRATRIAGRATSPEETTAVADFGAGVTSISIFRGDILAAARVINLGGSHFTMAIMDKLDISYSAAEAEKYRAGLTSNSELSPVLTPLKERLFAEIARSINYYFTEHSNESLSRVQILGGASLMSGLESQLEHYLHEHTAGLAPLFRVTLCNPLHYMEHSLPNEAAQALGPMLGVAIGLALGEVQHP